MNRDAVQVFRSWIPCRGRSGKHTCGPQVEMLEQRVVPTPSSFESASGIAAQFGTYEVVLTGNGLVANPFNTTGTVTFRAPSNQTVTVNDFYDGGNTWRARVYVTETGLWHWSASSSTDPGLNGTSGTFTASDTGLPGLLQLNPSNPKAWMTSRGQWFDYIGDAAWLLFNQNPTFSPDYQGFVNDAATQGINTLGPVGLLGAWGSINPTVPGLGNNDPWSSGNNTTYDLSKFQTSDTRVEWIFNNHPTMYVQGQFIGTEWQYNNAWENLPASVRNNTLNYMIARWGAFPNMIWLVSEDQFTDQASTQAFNRDVGSYLVAHEPWKHLLSTESINESFAFTTASDLNWVDYIPLQVGTDPVALGADQVQTYANVPRHVQLTEDWYEQDDFWHPELSATADINFFVRWDFWSWTLAGGSANYGARSFAADPYSQTGTDSYQDPISPFTDFSGQALHGLDSLPFLGSYFQSRNIDLSRFQPNNSLVTSWSMSSGDNWHPNLTQRGTNEFLVYDPNAGQQGDSAHLDGSRTASMTIDLTSAPGTYQVEWYRPSDGTVQSGGTVTGGALRTFTAPWQGYDVLLHLILMPTTPTNLTATAGNAQVTLAWAASTGATSYNIYRSTSPGGEGSTPFMIGVSGTIFTDTGLTNGTTYYYRVTAVNSVGESSKSSEASATPQPALVAAYSFDEGSGTTVADVSGNGNTGTIVNATWTTTSKYGSALSFNGTNSWVTINDSASLHLTLGMTLEAWVDPSTVTSAWTDIIYKGNENYFLSATTTNGGVPVGGVIAGGTYGEAFGTTTLVTNTWTHVAATYDGTAVRLYVNGVLVSTQAHTGSILTSTNSLQIGGDSIYGQFFQGIIDEVRVYNVALTAAQIQQDMNTPINTPDTQPPTPPGTLTTTSIAATQVKLSWVASTDNMGMTSYLVERQDPGASGFVQVGTTTTTNFSDTGLTAGSSYSYRVRAADAAGNLSGYSNVALITTLPPAPIALVAVGRANQVALNWNAANGATSYNIYRSTVSGGEGGTPFLSGVTSTTFTDTGLTNGTTYYYQMTAVNSAGESAMSSEASATPQPPPLTPTNLTVTPGNAQVNLSWSASSGATSYNIYRSTVSGAEGSTVYQSGVTTTSYTDTGVANGTTYYYQVSAVSIAGESSKSSQVTAVPQVPGLVATNVTSTPTGFTATFSQPLNVSVLNLIDTGTGTFGPADVTLEGQNTGPVSGSLVFSPDAMTVTFIRTAGLLPTDTYTLTLRSAANGFVSTTGNLLDGNADGTPGDNLTYTFTVSPLPSNAVVVSIPNFTRGYGQPVNLPASGNSGLPILLSTGLNVGSINLTLHYNPALLTLTGFTTTIPGASATFNVTTPGTAVVTVSSATQFSTTAGQITLGSFTASVPNNAPYDAKEILDVTNLVVLDSTPGTPQPLPAVAQDALHVAAYFGDVNGDQSYSVADVILQQRLIGLINGGFPAYQATDPVLLGDITLDGLIQANDVTSIQREVGLVNVPNIPALPPGLPSPPSGGPDPVIFIPNVHGNPGDVVTVPVQMTVKESGGITVSGFQVAIAYDPTKFTVSNVAQLGSMFSAFSGLLTFPAPGMLIFLASSGPGTGTIPFNTTTDLFDLTFTVAAGASSGSSVINLLQNIQTTNTAIFDDNLTSLTLSTPPTNNPTDSVDGTFTIGSATVSTVSVQWGSQAALIQTATNGVSLLPSGRTTDLPWQNINKLAIILSHAAVLNPSDVSVTGLSGGNYGPVTISGSGTNYVLTLAKPIAAADRVTITLGNTQITTFTGRIDVLPGDVNGDGVVNVTDGTFLLSNTTPTHAYQAIYDFNGDGVVNTSDFTLYRPFIGTVLPALPAQLATGGEGPGGATRLTPDEVAPILTAAINNWEAAELPPQKVALLQSVTVQITNLPTGYLGVTAIGGDILYLSADAAGYGWFIDPSVGADIPAGREDLLTVVMHELGHTLGLNDLNPTASTTDLMAQSLATGVRRLPSPEDVIGILVTQTVATQATPAASTSAVGGTAFTTTDRGADLPPVALLDFAAGSNGTQEAALPPVAPLDFASNSDDFQRAALMSVAPPPDSLSTVVAALLSPPTPINTFSIEGGTSLSIVRVMETGSSSVVDTEPAAEIDPLMSLDGTRKVGEDTNKVSNDLGMDDLAEIDG